MFPRVPLCPINTFFTWVLLQTAKPVSEPQLGWASALTRSQKPPNHSTSTHAQTKVPLALVFYQSLRPLSVVNYLGMVGG